MSTGKYTFCLKGPTKRQMVATFTVSATGAFLPIQLFYQAATKGRLSKYKFLKKFHIMDTILSSWTHSRVKTTRRLTLYAWKIIANSHSAPQLGK